MLRQYGDNIKIAVVAFGPGIHVLLKNPSRPVTQTVREKITSLSDYGVDFYACGNTLKSLKQAEKDVVPFAKVVEVGASTLMTLQKQGYAYISW
jgi:intracellular sulfur oxidation DsrE/DsrF family protein